LKELQPSLSEELNRLEATLSNNVLKHWYKEALAVNNFYFEQFAEEQKLAPWLPFFVAEHALRPYLQKAAVEMADILKGAKGHEGCPACGEPSRLAIINSNAKKEITCPRCNYSWEEKKISCAHCGNDVPKEIEILKIEKEEQSEIYVCQSCKGYTKVIDARKLMKVEAPALLDIKSIHLDYIAHENGFGVPEVKGTH
jgi:FdhE protein